MIDIESNAVDLEQLLGDMADKAGDLTGAWPKVGSWWRARQLSVFATGNRGAWPTRDPDTKKMGRGLMIRTGALQRAASQPKPLYSSASSARFGMTPGGPAYYGLFHQTGAGVPVRQVVPPLTPSEATEIVEIIRDHIMEAAS